MLDKIKKLRERTGVGVVEVKKALEEAGGNEEKAIEILRKRGREKAVKKSERSTGEGLVVSYIHSNKKVGTMLKLYCESDFVAKNEEFQQLALDIAMHITAIDPQYLAPENIPDEVISKEKEIWMENLKNEKKPAEIMEKILEGKEKKFREENALLTQPFVKNPDQTVGEMIAEKIGKIGENIQVGEFCRFEL